MNSPLPQLWGGLEGQLGQACLAYLYFSLDTLSRGTLYQLMGPWKLLEVSCLFSSSIALILLILVIIFTHMLLRKITHHALYKLYLCLHLANCIHSSCKLSSCKLYLFILQTIILQTVSIHHVNYIHSLVNYHLANCISFLPFQHWAV